MKGSVTIRDVAKHAGVGIGTVSRVLNQSESVSDNTRQKVLAAIEELDFTPNLSARRLSLGKTMVIGVILPFFTNPSYVERLRGIESVLAETDYDMVLLNADTPDRRDQYFQDIRRRERIDGLMIITHAPSDQDVLRFAQARVAVVLIDAEHPEVTRVVIDNVQAAYEATRHLIDLGHVRIGFISDFLETSLNFRPVRDRHLGYYHALTEYGIPYRAQYHKQGPHGRGPARQLARELLTMAEPPTAIFAYSDTQAIGAMEAARDLGLRIPRDLSVVGFDDIEAAGYWRLTTMHQPLFESGATGCRLLLDQISQPDASSEPVETVLPTELVVRHTSAPPAVA